MQEFEKIGYDENFLSDLKAGFETSVFKRRDFRAETFESLFVQIRQKYRVIFIVTGNEAEIITVTNHYK